MSINTGVPSLHRTWISPRLVDSQLSLFHRLLILGQTEIAQRRMPSKSQVEEDYVLHRQAVLLS